jgi:hypothetical protein
MENHAAIIRKPATPKSRMRRPSIASLTIITMVFLLFSSALWGWSNNFELAQPEGYDPLRYEYYARSDLPDFLADTTAYTLVPLMQMVYSVLPHYFGFVFFIFFFMVATLATDSSNRLKIALFSPITFLYIAQTGKDGMAIIGISIAAHLGMRYKPSAKLIFMLAIAGLALFIRPTLAPVLLVTIILFRHGLPKATITSFLIVGLLNVVSETAADLSRFESAVSDEASGVLAQLGRELTFGFSVLPTLVRFFLYFFSLFIQPISAVIKVLSGADSYVIFEGLCQLAFICLVIQRKIMRRFFLNSIPFVIMVAAASPFYHFRYLAVCFPIIFLYCIMTPQIRTLSRSERSIRKTTRTSFSIKNEKAISA